MDNFRDSYFNVTWDLTKKHLRGTFWGKQYDTGRGFAVTIVEGGKVTVPSNETVRLKWEKPDGTEGYVTAVVVDDKFLIEDIDQMFTVHGAVRSDLEIWRGGKVISSITFYVSVEKAVAVDAIESSSDFTALQDAVGSVDSLQQQFNNVVANVTVDSEVIAARGTEPTLGARLDGAEQELMSFKEDYANLKNAVWNVSPNIFNIGYSGVGADGKIYENALNFNYIFSSAGVISENTSGALTYPIPVIGGKTIYLYRLTADNEFTWSACNRIASYDKNFNFLSYEASVSSFYIPLNAKYIRIWNDASYMPGWSSSTMLSYSSEETEFIPFYEPYLVTQDLQIQIDDINEYISGEYVISSEQKIKEFTALFNGTNNIEAYIFYTDTHLQGLGTVNYEKFINYMSTLKKIYDCLPTNYILCGGDWLDNNDTREEACYKLGLIDGYVKSNFKNHYMVLGNHDTNYQGFEYVNSGYDTTKVKDCILSDSTIKNLLFREQGKAYYTFNGMVSKNFVLDTGVEWYDWLTEYRWEQIDWLCTELLKNESAHNTIILHATMNASKVHYVFADTVGQVISTFNAHSSVTLNGKTYDFSSCTGKIEYVLSGHTHLDIVDSLGGVPCVLTTNFTAGNIPTFDLILVDYDNSIIHLTRIGTGLNRTVNLV